MGTHVILVTLHTRSSRAPQKFLAPKMSLQARRLPWERQAFFESLLKVARVLEEKLRLARLFNFMKAEIRFLENRVGELESPAVPAAVYTVATRPPSSAEALATRQALRDSIVAAVGDDDDSNSAIIDLISDEHALELVNRYRADAIVTEIQCFESGLAPAHRNDYVKVNLRKTKSDRKSTRLNSSH